MTAIRPNARQDDRVSDTLSDRHGANGRDNESTQTPAIPAEIVASLSSLPGLVLYQRVVTPEGAIRYTYISEGARELFGVSPADILSNPETLFACHTPDYRAKFKERLLKASASLALWEVEASIITVKGKKKFTHAIARPERKADGSVLWTGVILDETRTREAVLESLSQGLLLFDAQDTLILRNSHVLKLYPCLKDVAVPGARFEDVLLAELAANASLPTAEKINLFRSRIDRQRRTEMFQYQGDDDRWILVNQQGTSEGGTVVFYTDITELKLREKEIEYLAHHDRLTGLSNRAVFQRRAEEVIAAAKEKGGIVVIMCLDLDHFKHVNDTLGHAGGDEFLKAIAERLRGCVGDFDTVARLGGDEFGLILTEISSPDAATTFALRLMEIVNQPFEFDQQRVSTGISIGIALAPFDGDGADAVIKNADLALYRAKVDGRGTFCFFEAEMDARARHRRSLEIDLRQTISKKQLELHYQPQIDVATNAIVACEALVRWYHPQRGLIFPAEFIPLAEETQLISSVGKWVLRRACADAVKWPKSIGVAVNVSPAQFRNRNLTQLVAEILKETGLEPNRLELEITESILLRDIEENLETLRCLKNLGVRISMDDFGTGYSSLGNLRSFPFDKIKIDRSFVSDLQRRADAAAIVRAVLGLGQSLGMKTCAEGVETKEQFEFLRAAGCTEVQGFYFSKPKPLNDVVVLLKAGATLPVLA